MCCERKSWELADWWSDHQMLCWHSVIPLGFRMCSAWLLNQIMAQSPFLKSNRGIFLSLLVLSEIHISNMYKQLHLKALFLMVHCENVVVNLAPSGQKFFFFVPVCPDLDTQQPASDPDFMKHIRIATLKNILFQTVQIPSLWLRLQHWNQSQMTHLWVIFLP